MQILIRVLLVAAVLTGLGLAGRLAFNQYQTGEACPILGDTVPACYIAFFSYVLIAIGVVISMATASSIGSYPFWTGTAIAGGLAALATVFEFIKGDICPVGPYGIPTCYISLALSIIIAVLYVLQSSQATSEITLNG